MFYRRVLEALEGTHKDVSALTSETRNGTLGELVHEVRLLPKEDLALLILAARRLHKDNEEDRKRTGGFRDA